MPIVNRGTIVISPGRNIHVTSGQTVNFSASASYSDAGGTQTTWYWGLLCDAPGGKESPASGSGGYIGADGSFVDVQGRAFERSSAEIGTINHATGAYTAPTFDSTRAGYRLLVYCVDPARSSRGDGSGLNYLTNDTCFLNALVTFTA